MNQKKETNKYDATVNLPYPPVQSGGHKREYAYAMLSNIASNICEMNAISLYFYNSVILNPDYAEFARCFDEVSIIEMHHLNIFATLAYQMGVDPRLWSSRNRRAHYWSPSYNQYPRKIREVIENSIKGEEATIAKYNKQMQIINDANIVENLKRIIIDEKRHIEVFNMMLESLN